jgi:hypothetical protein
MASLSGMGVESANQYAGSLEMEVFAQGMIEDGDGLCQILFVDRIRYRP